MCGLSIVLGADLDAADINMFKNMLTVSQLRGADSTGMFQVREPGKNHNPKQSLGTNALKAAVNSTFFLDTKQADKFLQNNIHKRVLVGHARAATVGSISDENAHPFDMDNVIGAVNGTVTKFDIPDHLGFETDSEAMLNYIDQNDKLEACATLIGLPRAPFAMIFFDRRDNTLNILRSEIESSHESRPLVFYYDKDHTRLYGSSEWWMAFGSAQRNNVILDTKAMSFSPNVNELVVFSLNDDKFIRHPKLIKLVPKRKPVQVYSGSRPAVGTHYPIVDWSQYSDTLGAAKATANEIVSSSATAADLAKTAIQNWPIKQDKKNNSDLEALGERLKKARAEYKKNHSTHGSAVIFDSENDRQYHGPDGAQITERRFREIIGTGCAVCDAVVDWKEPNLDTKIAYLFSDIGTRFICEDCADGDPEWLMTYGRVYKPADALKGKLQ
jgi:hypothetical protein